MSGSIKFIKTSDGTGNASMATVQSGRTAPATTLIVDTVDNFPPFFMGTMGTPHTFTDPVTSEEITVISEATAVDFAGHVDGTHLVIDTIAPGYTDGGSEVGDIVVVRPTTQWGDNVAAVLEVILNDDGTLKNNIVQTANIANDSVTPAKLALSKTTDANGWTIYDYGDWKEYRKTFTGSSVGGSGSGVLNNIYTNLNTPAGIAPNTLHWMISAYTTAFASEVVVLPEFNPDSASTSYTFNVHAYRHTGSGVAPAVVAVRAITK